MRLVFYESLGYRTQPVFWDAPLHERGRCDPQSPVVSLLPSATKFMRVIARELPEFQFQWEIPRFLEARAVVRVPYK